MALLLRAAISWCASSAGGAPDSFGPSQSPDRGVSLHLLGLPVRCHVCSVPVWQKLLYRNSVATSFTRTFSAVLAWRCRGRSNCCRAGECPPGVSEEDRREKIISAQEHAVFDKGPPGLDHLNFRIISRCSAKFANGAKREFAGLVAKSNTALRRRASARPKHRTESVSFMCAFGDFGFRFNGSRRILPCRVHSSGAAR